MTLTELCAQEQHTDTLRLKVFFKRSVPALDVSYLENWSRLSDFQGEVKSLREQPGYTLDKLQIRTEAVDTIFSSSRADGEKPAAAVRSGDRRLADYIGMAARNDEIPGRVLEVQFHIDQTDIDEDFAGNRERIERFFKDYRKTYIRFRPEDIRIDIYAGASPEGPPKNNLELGSGRCKAIAGLLQERLSLPPSRIVEHNLGSRWNDLYDAVSASSEPWRSEVLAIIRRKPAFKAGMRRDPRENKLRALRGGKVWPDLLEHYLKPLRSGGSAVVSLVSEKDSSRASVPVAAGGAFAAGWLPAAPIRDTLFLTENREQACKNCVALPLRRAVSAAVPAGAAGMALSPEYMHLLSSLVRDTLEIRFRLDSIRIDPGFAGNSRRIERFMDAFNRRYAGLDPSAMRLDIYAGASPEGAADHNRWLGQERGSSIRRLLGDSLGIRVGNIEIHNMEARWDDFYDAVKASDEPWKDEVLAIIRQTPSRDTRLRDRRELLLRALDGGRVWPVLLERYLSPLRSGCSAVLSLNPDYLPRVCGAGAAAMGAAAAGGAAALPGAWQYAGDTLWVCGAGAPASRRDTVFVMQNTPYGMYPHDRYPWRVPDGYYVDDSGRLRREKVKKVVVPADKTPAWAIKTNLLFWGVVAPNIQLEFPLGWSNHWSLEVEYVHPWFIWDRNSHASQILNLGLELRYYFGDREYHRWLDGWHVGLAFGGGKYDWEWKRSEGWQGEFINPYINVGYQHRFGKNWAVDAGIGLGVIASRYRHYYGGSVYPENHLEPQDNHLIWHDTGHLVFPGATHINLSISYMFNNWPVRFKTMSEEQREEWRESYYKRVEREAKRQEKKQNKQNKRTE